MDNKLLIKDILKRYWNYDNFRDMQEDIILSVIEGNDNLVILPTGGGKSICYQIPALALPGVCIVVSPLIALMKDQVESLQKKGIEAHAIISGMPYKEIDLILDNSAYGNIKLLYVSPERLHSELFIERFKKMNVSFIAVDEAHCISQWGYDFRPAYLEIATLKALKPDIPIIALTASATPKVKNDIADKLNLKSNYSFFIKSFERKNLSYNVRYEEDKFNRLIKILNSIKGSVIIYVRSRNKTEELCKFLIENHFTCDYYHAGLSSYERNKKQNLWISDKIRIIVATNAFGMGIDKPDVRLVIHFDITESMESYYQEAGRAGRDGKISYAVTLYNNNDIAKLKRQLSTSNISIKQTKKVYEAIGNYYNLAEGSGKNKTYDFDLFDFCKIFKLNLIQSRHCLKLLNDENYLSINEAFLIPSRINFIVRKNQLYAFLEKNSVLSEFVKLLLRSYEGVFDNYIKVYEQKIARQINASEDQVISNLKRLHKNRIINYIPQSDKPRITFTEERLPLKNLYFDKSKIKQLQKVRSKNIEKILNFISNEKVCRSKMILQHFGEKSTENCGICNYCRENKMSSKRIFDQADLRNNILSLLYKNEKSIEDLISSLHEFKDDEVTSTIELMLANKEIKRSKDLKNFYIQ